MNDIATESVATESAEPAQSTAEIAAGVIEAGEQPEQIAEPETPVETPAAETPAEKAVTKSEASRAAEFLRKMGHELKRSDGRRAFMPLDAVAKMLDSYVEEHATDWTSKYSAVEAEAKELRGYVEQLRAGVSGDPKAFLAELAQHDPRYAAFLESNHQPPTPNPDSKMPEPDLPLQDGSRTYSVEGLQKLIEWAVESKMLPKVDERLKPITEREQQARARAEQQQQLQSRTRAMLTEAQTWPMFGALAADGTLTPFQQEVFEAYKADKSLDLHKAYMKVALPRLTEDDNKKRERLLKEMQTAPRRPALGTQQTDTAKPVAQSTADIARSILAAER